MKSEGKIQYGEIYPHTIQTLVLPKDKKYNAVWIQFVAMYISDGQFVDLLTMLRQHLLPDGVIFIKENLVKDGDTVKIEGEFDGAQDLSLVRSANCFKYIFQKASYEFTTFDTWTPSEQDYSILTACIKPVA